MGGPPFVFFKGLAILFSTKGVFPLAMNLFKCESETGLKQTKTFFLNV
jgi:hypothetical protein